MYTSEMLLQNRTDNILNPNKVFLFVLSTACSTYVMCDMFRLQAVEGLCLVYFFLGFVFSPDA